MSSPDERLAVEVDDVGVELAVDGRAESGRYAVRHHLDHCAQRGAALSHRVEFFGKMHRGLGVGREEGGVRRDDQASLAPRFARAVGAQELGDGLDRRLHRQDVESDAGEMPALQEIGERVDIADRPARGAHHHGALGHALEHGARDHAARLQRERRVN